MRRGANAAMRLFHALAVVLQIGYEFRQVLGRKILSCDDHGRRVRGEADRNEIALGIVFQVRREHRGGDVGAHAAREQGVAVRRRGRHARAPDRAAGAADILDDHGLAEDFPHLLGHDARDDVARPAGRKRHHHRDGPRWVTLRVHAKRRGKDSGHRDADEPRQPARAPRSRLFTLVAALALSLHAHARTS